LGVIRASKRCATLCTHGSTTADAPTDRRSEGADVLADETYRPELPVGGDANIGNVFEAIVGNINDIAVSAPAGTLGMSGSTDSRRFRKISGDKFVDCAGQRPQSADALGLTFPILRIRA